MDLAYPLPAFHFSVAIAGSGQIPQQAYASDASFSEISGLEATLNTEDVREGGQNQFVHRLPTGTKYQNLVFKRGVVAQVSYLAAWATETIGSTFAKPITTQTLVVMLLGPDQSPRLAWNVRRAWPVRWDWGKLNAKGNEVLVEVIEFAHSGIFRIDPSFFAKG
jgi:phage tail-like protein